MMTYQAGYEQIKRFIEQSILEWRGLTTPDEMANSQPILDTLDRYLVAMQTKLDDAAQTPINRDNLFRVIGALNTIAAMKAKGGWFSSSYIPTLCTAQMHQCILRATEIYGDAEWANRERLRLQQLQEHPPGNGNDDPELRASVLELRGQVESQSAKFEQLAQNNQSLQQKNAELQQEISARDNQIQLFQSNALEVQGMQERYAQLEQENALLKMIAQKAFPRINVVDLGEKTPQEIEEILEEDQRRQNHIEPTKPTIYPIEEKYQKASEIFPYEIPPVNETVKREWAQDHPTDYEKYKLDCSVSPAIYYAVLQLNEYYKSLSATHSMSLSAQNVVGEKKRIADVIYQLLSMSLDTENYYTTSLENKLTQVKESFIQNGGSSGGVEAIQRVISQIESLKLSDELPQGKLSRKATYLHQLASDRCNLLPNDKQKRDEFSSISDSAEAQEKALARQKK